jgi:hypothetical protein
MTETLYLRQIVPFEIKISVSGLEASEDGHMTFTAGWSTQTTSGGEFGYEYEKYGVLAAFVDTGDGAHVDNGPGVALVCNFTWSHVIDPKGNEIQGVYNVTGLDEGDDIVVEVSVVIQSTFPAGATGNVHSRLISARTLTTKDTINTGTQTVPMMPVNKGVGPGGLTDDTQLRLAVGTAAEEELFC